MELRDQKSRDVIANALDKNLMVLAGAGAGKTHEMVGRMVNAVCTGAVDVAHMAAITFTRKAAGEMRGRFFSRLKACVQERHGEAAERARRGLEKIDQCYVGTIHSFCGQLLRERPVEAGVPPDFSEVEAREEAVLRREAWDRFVQQRFLAEDERLAQFEALGLRTEDLYAFFIRRCEFSDVALKLEAVEKPDLKGAIDAAIAFVDRAFEHFPDPLPGKRDGAQTAMTRARLFVQNRGISSDADCVALLAMLNGRLSVTLKGWAPHRDFAKELRDVLLPDFQERVLGPILTQWRQYVYGFAADFVDDAVAFYADSRRSAGRLTFQDLLALAARLLRDHSDVRRYFQDRYRCLFVDEFQDTDPIQAEVLLYLTGTDVEETDWRRLMPHSGRLFLVGDEKQSIYRFRRADVETFRLVRDRVAETGGEVVYLNTSFRSLGRLCDWANAAFEPLFEVQDERYQAAFGPLFKFKPDGADAFSVRKILCEKAFRHSRRSIVEQDAERVADFIAAAIAGETEFNGDGLDAILSPQASPGDFLILTRTTGYLSHYAQALEDRGIPFDMTGGSRLGDAVEVQALVDFLEAAYVPDNPLPLLSYLRGDLVGLGDDDLYAFKRAGGRFDYTQALPGKLDGEVRERFVDAFGKLTQAREWLGLLPASAAVERIVDALGLMPFARSLPMGATRAGNLMRALALVRTWTAEGMHWGQVVEELRALIDDTDYDVAQMSLTTGRTDVVRLMNLHQSKGLQGRVVFLVDPYDTRYKQYGPEFHVSRTGDDPFLAMPVTKPRGYAREVIAEPVGWAEDEAEEARFLNGEELRLLYVAATRAEHLLVVSVYEGNSDKGPWAPLGPFLDEIPELSRYPSAVADVPTNRTVDVERAREDQAAFWAGISEPSLDVQTVTDDREDVFVERSEPAHGAAFGTVVHRLFDDAIHDRLPDDSSAYVRHLLEREGAESGFLEDALSALTAFRASDIWRELQAAAAVYTEVPFAVSKPDGILRGVIDLVYRLPDGWKIVDYKTDAVVTDGEVNALVEQSALQVNAYAEHWAKFAGEPVVEKGLWLTQGNIWREV